MSEFQNKCIVITGVGGDLGYSLLKFFIKKKSKIIGFAKTKRSYLKGYENKKNIKIFYGDLADEDFVKSKLQKKNLFDNKIHHLINCAGSVSSKKISQIDLNDWYKLIDDNLTSTFLVTKFSFPLFAKYGNRSIVNISSIAGQRFSKTAGVHYTSTKAGLIGFTKQLAVEKAKYKIRINCIAPGQIDSKMLDKAIKNSKNKKNELINAIPLKRLARTEDIVNVCEFLCSEKSSYLTGTTIAVNGGVI
jgi:NAD(P)-dependent dehydrogenase (short-subunit alcohol dehydrogenase family)